METFDEFEEGALRQQHVFRDRQQAMAQLRCAMARARQRPA
ncbi:MAG: hypothetical protein ABI693_34785 [Bryobacteraceae bacterium]